MNTTAIGIALIGMLSTIGSLAVYFSKILNNKVPVFPAGLLIFLPVGIICGAYALHLSMLGESLTLILVAVPSAISIIMGSLFLYVYAQRRTPIGNIKVKVGDKFLNFTTKNSEGKSFDNSNLSGKRILFKFFRGSWCPYCSAELNMFKEMAPEFQKYNIELVALSNDTEEEAKHHKVRDSLSFTLLSDPELEVIRQFGVEHQKALGADAKNTFMLFGIPFPKTLKFKSMSIPTSILIDENGTIKWIDQSEDYRLRASRESVLGAISEAFGAL